MKSVTNKFKSGGLHEKHVVATWNLGNHLIICLQTQGNQEKPVSRWPVAGPNSRILKKKVLDEKFHGRRLVGRPRHKREENNRRFLLLLNVRKWTELGCLQANY